MPRIRRLVYVFFLGLPGWAASGVPGINNFHEVDEKVYRGAQPTDEGFHYLATLGVKVVLDLREHDARSLSEERVVTAAGMRYINVPMAGLTPPTQTETNMILTLLEDPSAGPVFVHCKRGADRTGAVIAAYRIDHDKWDNARALREALATGMRWMQFQRQRYISTFSARTTDAADVKPVAAPANADAGVGIVVDGTIADHNM
jgi:tyrosine-protein phosphatase SIW14